MLMWPLQARNSRSDFYSNYLLHFDKSSRISFVIVVSYSPTAIEPSLKLTIVVVSPDT